MGTRADGMGPHFEQTPIHASTGYEPDGAGGKREYVSDEALKLKPMSNLFERGSFVQEVKSMLNRVDGMYVLSNMAKKNPARQTGMGARVFPGYTPSKDLLSKVTLEALKGRGLSSLDPV